jgi:hypothetical protein
MQFFWITSSAEINGQVVRDNYPVERISHITQQSTYRSVHLCTHGQSAVYLTRRNTCNIAWANPFSVFILTTLKRRVIYNPSSRFSEGQMQKQLCWALGLRPPE